MCDKQEFHDCGWGEYHSERAVVNVILVFRGSFFDENHLVSIRKLRMRNYWFPIRKGRFFVQARKSRDCAEALTRPLATLSLRERVTVSLLPLGEG
jgi:hypothetical protein